MTGRLRTLLARRSSPSRWGYVPALPALAFFTALGRDEGIPTVLYLRSPPGVWRRAERHAPPGTTEDAAR